MDRASSVLESCERRFTSLIELDGFKMQDVRVDTRKFGHELVRALPQEIEKFFGLQQLDCDISQNFANSPRDTLVSFSDMDSPASGQSNTSPKELLTEGSSTDQKLALSIEDAITQ